MTSNESLSFECKINVISNLRSLHYSLFPPAVPTRLLGVSGQLPPGVSSNEHYCDDDDDYNCYFFSFWLCQFDCSFVILDFKLADFPYDVEDSILQLDSDSSPVQKNWKHIAYEYEITKQTIQVLERECRKPGISAIRLLIEKLCSSKCATLKEFVDVLQELERNDVANDIISWFTKKQDRCSEEGKNW